MGICKESGVEILDTDIDWAHRIGVLYVDKTTKRSCKSVIFRLSSFHQRITVYQAKKNMKNFVRFKIDLTKKCHNLLVSANTYISNINSVKFCYADVNCRPKKK